jgi:hypothetical protein
MLIQRNNEPTELHSVKNKKAVYEQRLTTLQLELYCQFSKMNM